jgi:glycosyltransferase involved in cell wall biosynthesis
VRLGGFAITHLRPAVLRETLERVLAQDGAPEAMVVVDNGRSLETREVARELGDRHNREIEYLDPGDNLGPAGAAALGLEWALERGFDWIYWCDDDDPPKTPDTFARLRALASAGGGPGERPVAGVAAVGARWDWRHGRLVRPADDELSGPLEVDAIGGNSQLLLSAPAVREIGLPDPALFYGWEEIEYCLRLRRAGFRLLVEGDLMHRYRALAGRLGAAEAPRLTPRDGLWRDYYAVRNYVYLMRRRFDRPDLARREAVRALARSVRALGRGPGYALATARHQLGGAADGYRARLGRTVEPRAKARPAPDGGEGGA